MMDLRWEESRSGTRYQFAEWLLYLLGITTGVSAKLVVEDGQSVEMMTEVTEEVIARRNLWLACFGQNEYVFSKTQHDESARSSSNMYIHSQPREIVLEVMDVIG
jgi:hypothetical protein